MAMSLPASGDLVLIARFNSHYTHIDLRGTMRKEGLAAVIAILVVASLGIGYLSGTSTRATETVTSVSTSTVTSTTTSISTETSVFTHGILVPTSSASTLNPLTGLSLDLNLSASTYGQVVVTTYEFNTLDRVNNVSYGARVGLNPSFFQWVENNCEVGGMVGYQILQGNYGLDNFTSGTALWLQPQNVGMQCGGIEPQNSHYTFMPLSNQSVTSGAYVGSWADSSIDSTYHPFVPGTYTVVAGDEWSTFVILHFTVAG